MPKGRTRRILPVRPRRLSPRWRKHRLAGNRHSKEEEPAGTACSCPSNNPPIITEEPLELDFSGPRDLFLSLVHPVTEEEFFTNYWESKPLLISRGGSNLPLFTLETLQELASSDEHTLRFGRHINVCRYKNGRRQSYGEQGEVLTPKLLDNLWNKKLATFQFLQPQQFQDKLWHMLSLLESYFNCLVGSNVYITPEGSQGLAPHYDDIEVFIIQIEGRKRWRLYPPTLPLPLTSSPDLQLEEIGSPSHDILLNVGDVLYFPRGTIHHASTLPSSHSTHITISTYQQNTWGDLLSDAFSSTIQQLMATKVEYRKGIPLQLLSQNMLKEPGDDYSGETRDQLQNMGQSVLQCMANNHMDLMRKSRLAFISARLPPFISQSPPYGPAPSVDSMVQLMWPDHIVVFTGADTSEMKGNDEDGEEDMEEEEEEEEEGKEGKEEAGKGSKVAEVVIYHSLSNNRSSHMVAGEEEPHGVKLPGRSLPGLSFLLSSASYPIPASTLPLSPEDTLSCLFPLWVEGLLQVT